MKKKYVKPIILVEDNQGLLLLKSSGVKGMLENVEEITWGGVDEDGEYDPSANGNNSWDDNSWDKL